jgi:hypothetical protein
MNKNKELWVFPFYPQSVRNDVVLTLKGLEAQLSFSGVDNESDKIHYIIINFSYVVRFKQAIFNFYEHGYDVSYAGLGVIKNSEWTIHLQKLFKKDERYFKYWKDLKHYAICFQDEGMYEFLSQDVEVFVDDKKIELL